MQGEISSILGKACLVSLVGLLGFVVPGLGMCLEGYLSVWVVMGDDI